MVNSWEAWLEPVLYKPFAGEGAAEHAVHHSAAMEWGAMGLSVLVAVLGIWFATTWYKNESERPGKLATSFSGLYKLFLNKYFVDELYFSSAIRPFMKICSVLWWWDRWIIDGIVNGVRHLTIGASHASFAVDKYVVDGAGVNGTAATFQWLSRINRRIQTGQFQHYALGLVAGFVLIVVWYLYLQ